MNGHFEIDSETVSKLIRLAEGPPEAQRISNSRRFGDLRLAQSLLEPSHSARYLKSLVAGNMTEFGGRSCDSLKTDPLVRECYRAICSNDERYAHLGKQSTGLHLTEEITKSLAHQILVGHEVLFAVVAAVLFVIQEAGIEQFCRLASAKKWNHPEGKQ